MDTKKTYVQMISKLVQDYFNEILQNLEANYDSSDQVSFDKKFL